MVKFYVIFFGSMVIAIALGVYALVQADKEKATKQTPVVITK